MMKLLFGAIVFMTLSAPPTGKALILLPTPKTLELGPDAVTLKNGLIVIPSQDLYFTAKTLKEYARRRNKVELTIEFPRPGAVAAVEFVRDEKLSGEAYSLSIQDPTIQIRYGTPEAAFRAMTTLKQLILQRGQEIPCGFVSDAPDFPVRGISFDISRNRIPTLPTLFKLVDLMADWKLNQLQLYIEGFSFAYRSYPQLTTSGTPLTGEEIIELDRYCRERFIDLVPNQNSFGHMDAWLRRPEFKDLAECPDGFYFRPGWFMNAGTVNGSDARALQLLENMQDDLLPYFSSKLYNVCCDETYELGKGRNKEAADKFGVGKLFLNHLLKLREMAEKRGKKIMFWADVMSQNPKFISELPKDVIALEWGYEDSHPFKSHGARFKSAGVPFYVCPGASVWYSFTGRTDNMKRNLLSAALNGKEQGAAGFLNTHWGDIAHYHHLPAAYPGFAYGAALSWGVEQNRNIDLAAALDRLVFEDRAGKMGQLTLDLGNYYRLEKQRIHDGTALGRILFSPLDDMGSTRGNSAENFSKIRTYAEDLRPTLDRVDLQCEDAAWILEEYRNLVHFVIHAAKLGELKFQKDPKPQLPGMIDDISVLIRDFRRAWLLRNRPGNGYTDNTISGLDEAVRFLENLKKQYLLAISDKR